MRLGYTIKEAAEILCCSEHALRAVMKELGIKPRRKLRWEFLPLEEARALVGECPSCRQWRVRD